MKNFKSIFIKTILFALFLEFMACSTETNKTYLIISSAKSSSSSRNIAEAVENLTNISLKGTLNGTETNLAAWENWNAANNTKIEIEPGSWTFTLTAYIEEKEYKQEYQSVVEQEIYANIDNTVSFTLKKLKTNETQETHETQENNNKLQVGIIVNIEQDTSTDTPGTEISGTGTSSGEQTFYLNNNLNDLYIKTSFPKEDSTQIYKATISFDELPDYTAEEAYCYNNTWHFSLAAIEAHCNEQEVTSCTITPTVKFEQYIKREVSEYSNWTNVDSGEVTEIHCQPFTYNVPTNCYSMDTPYFWVNNTSEGIKVIVKPYDEYTQKCHIGLKTEDGTVIKSHEYDYNTSNAALFKCVKPEGKYFITIAYYGTPYGDWDWRYNVQSTTQITAQNGKGEINYSMDNPRYDDSNKTLTFSQISFNSTNYIMQARPIIYLAEDSESEPNGANEANNLFESYTFDAESTSQDGLNFNLNDKLDEYCENKQIESVKFCVDIELHYIEKEDQNTTYEKVDWSKPHYIINPFDFYDETKKQKVSFIYTR